MNPTETGPIVLLTDFGTSDWFVGVMKGVIKRHWRPAEIIDLCHDIEPQNIRQAEFVLRVSRTWFPAGSIFLAVVDPGVGSERDPIIAFDPKHTHWYVGPNNGLFGFLSEDASCSARRIAEEETLNGQPPSATFHGRDIFAPAAAKLAAGLLIESLTDRDISILQLAAQHPAAGDGHIIYFDHFGNALTNITSESAARCVDISVQQDKRIAFHHTYSDVPPHQPLAYIGSAGFLEIAIRNGNARQTLGLRTGDTVRLHRT